MKYEKPKILQEETIDIQQLVAGCGLGDGGGIDCIQQPDVY